MYVNAFMAHSSISYIHYNGKLRKNKYPELEAWFLKCRTLLKCRALDAIIKQKARNLTEEAAMQVNEYQELAMTTLNPELSKKDVLINSVMGLCGESGEAIDIVKKWLAQGHELDREHLAKELGDIAWYLAEAATALDLPLEDIFQANIEKLKKRYPDGFESQRSRERESDNL